MIRRLLFVVLSVMYYTPASAQVDAIPFQSAQIVNAPDVRNWPITTALTSMSFDGSVTRVNFTKKEGPNRWPDVTPPGWSGPLEYTLWLCVQGGGQWTCSGFIQFWNGRDGSGTPSDPDVPSVYDKHWYYAERWTPIFGHGPIRPGETIGFLVTSGNARDSVGPYGPQERSNVVTLQATDNGSFSFPTTPAPTPTPQPQPVPVPVPIPAPLPTVQVCDLSALTLQVAAVGASVEAGRTENHAFFESVRGEWKKVLTYAAPIVGALLAGMGIK